MMLTSRSVFIHLPKTGGQWVAAVLRGSGVPHRSVLGEHALPAELLPVLGDRYSFTFIRHPVTWWRSLWQWSAAHSWPAEGGPWEPVTAGPVGATYREFMERILADCPGQYGRIVEAYTDGVQRVGRSECLRRDLALALASAGESITVPEMAPANVTAYGPSSVSDPALDAEIRRAEAQVIGEFYGGGPWR